MHAVKTTRGFSRNSNNQNEKHSGGEGGIRTPDRAVKPYNGLANRRLQPLGHLSDFNMMKKNE